MRAALECARMWAGGSALVGQRVKTIVHLASVLYARATRASFRPGARGSQIIDYDEWI